MFVGERHQCILDMVNIDGKVLVKELSKKFAVSEDCIRKDLAVLEKNGWLKRVYGGAVMLRENAHQPKSADRKQNENTEERKILAKKAYRLLKPNDFVFLDVSITSIEIANLLRANASSITVLTNMIDVMNILVEVPSVQVIFLGGTLNAERDGFWGNMTMQMLDSFRIDIAFLGVVGVNLQDGSLSTYVVEDGYMKQTVIKHSKASYLLCDDHKFKMDGNFVFAALTDVSGILLGKKQDEAILDKLSDYGLSIW